MASSTFIPLSASWITIAISIVWKRRMTVSSGTSYLGKKIKNKALAKKRRSRKRLNDFLTDDLLRREMVKEFEEKMGVEKCAEHMKELEFEASRDIAEDDAYVATQEVMKAAMLRIFIVFTVLIFLFFSSGNFSISIFAQFSLALLLHTVDNHLNRVSRPKITVTYLWWVLWGVAQYILSFLVPSLEEDNDIFIPCVIFWFILFFIILPMSVNYSTSTKDTSNRAEQNPPKQSTFPMEV
mmetsp:Transcript_31506/g.35829  ORF Transcript_31506/g.35829 Transcript_31506/m.35829 type:complete len:239 (-) Transcript_31506:180-896(-)